ncbi:MAG: endonuclease III domain-containing protein [Candidatus Bipolaricaulaceae bacterium]
MSGFAHPGRLLAALLAAYGRQEWWPAQSAFEIMVGAVLTQATAWRNAEQAVARLRAASALTPQAMAALPPDELAELVRPAGFPQRKVATLRTLAALVRHHGGTEPLLGLPPERLRAQLLSVPGIGPETADSICLYAAGQPAVVVDTYTVRILARLGVTGTDRLSPHKARQWIRAGLPADPQLYGEFHALLVRHGKEHCRARPRCASCPLAGGCAGRQGER